MGKNVIACITILISLSLFLSLSRADAASQEQFLISEIQKAIITDFSLSASASDSESTLPPIVPSAPTAGELKVSSALEKNRQELQKKQAQQLLKNKELLEKKKFDQSNVASKSLSEKAIAWRDSKILEVNQWTTAQQQMVANWQKDKEKLLQRIPFYKQNSINLEKEIKSDTPIIKKVPTMTKAINDLPLVTFSESFMIDQAFTFPVKDQGQRPTCAAFAGVRAMEIVLAQRGVDARLSEQYFYYLSLPECQRKNCSKQGSWVARAYLMGQKSAEGFIPKQSDCPYNLMGNATNTTQIPLEERCFKGVAKVDQFFKVTSSDQIVEALRRNMPVVAAFKLSSDFYQNNGHVFLSGPKGQPSVLDEHASGHALVLVGMMGLPQNLHATEGEYCLLVANSWGEGWGKGGHACLSKKWIERFRYPVDFIALKSVSVR